MEEKEIAELEGSLKGWKEKVPIITKGFLSWEKDLVVEIPSQLDAEEPPHPPQGQRYPRHPGAPAPGFAPPQ